MADAPFHHDLKVLLSPAQGVVGLAARHVESGREWLWNKHRPFPSASLIKLPILAAFEQAAEAGEIDRAERTRLPADARVGGSGVLQTLAPERLTSLRPGTTSRP